MTDTGVFAENRYFDIVIEYAKASPEDLCIKIEAFNRGDADAPLHLIPQLCFRNQWAWGKQRLGEPAITQQKEKYLCLVADEAQLAPPSNLSFEYRLHKRYLYGPSSGEGLFTNNEDEYTGKAPYKDAFHEAIIRHQKTGASKGSKAALHYFFPKVAAQSSVTLLLRLTDRELQEPLADVEEIIALRKSEADEFYATIHPLKATAEEKMIQRQAFAGMLWNKQIYLFDVDTWLDGDRPPEEVGSRRKKIRNIHWRHLNSMRILSMPDKWEYPWFAAWDLAFHSTTLGLIDIEFAKTQLWLLLFDQFQHPNGQIPAYEWEFSDTNPPTQAWAAWQIFNMEHQQTGKKDYIFLKRCFEKLLINFVWWVNKVDSSGFNVFEGGFLGLDNISLFDRSDKLPGGAKLQQSDGTGWMAHFCLKLMRIALELSTLDASYESLATKFFQHFAYIARAMKKRDDIPYELWNEEDGFFYDTLIQADGSFTQFRVRSLVGLIPLNAVESLTKQDLETYPEFASNFRWFLKNRTELTKDCVNLLEDGSYLLSILDENHLRRVLRHVWSPDEFRATYGLRSLSKYHKDHPVVFENRSVGYEPAEATHKVKGGNSNWRGPVWFPTSYFFIFSLRKFASILPHEVLIHPAGEDSLSLDDMARSFADRLISLYQVGEEGVRPFQRKSPFAKDPFWKDLLHFHEYFHPDTGQGLGASNQTGWTGLIANLIDEFRR